jgi:hypothetical protein
VAGSVHKPVVFEFDASKFFALADSEVINACRAPMKVSPLRGDVDGPFVTKFRELHDSLWKESDAQSLIDEINSTRFPALPEETRKAKLEAGYRQVTDTFTASLKQLERLYATGKSVKTYYSLEAVQIKKMIKACERWQLYWNRRLHEEEDTFGPNCLRGSSRNGHLGSAVSLMEMKERAWSLARKLRTFGSAGAGILKQSLLMRGLDLECSVFSMRTKVNQLYEEEQTTIWCGAYSEITEALGTLKQLHSASARLKLLEQIHDNVAKRNGCWQERKIRKCFSSALGKLPRANPIDKIEVDGQIISKVEQTSP